MKKIREINEIVWEATQCLCGTLDFEKGVNSFFTCLQQYLPLSTITFGRFDQAMQSVLLLSRTDNQSTRLLFQTIPMNKEQIALAEEYNFYDIKNTNKLIESKLHPLAKMYNFKEIETDFPLYSLRIPTDNGYYGGASFSFQENTYIDDTTVKLLNLLEPPIRIYISSFIRYWELEKIKNNIYNDNIKLRQKIAGTAQIDIIGANAGLLPVIQTVNQIAPLDISVLILGETGTGKELIAQTIHDLSQRNKGPFVAINCGAIPRSLIDNELFGHEKGAYTGASTPYKGRFERAEKGTLFLDEVAELPLDIQARLLRVLQEHTIERIGSHNSTPVNFRLIAATHKDLKQMVEENTFREDLYYRLKVASILIPPLRERKQDIPVLAQYFLEKSATRFGMRTPQISHNEMMKLTTHNWQGNVRELQNTIEVALATHINGNIMFDTLENTVSPHITKENPLQYITPYDNMQKDYLLWALNKCHGKIRGKEGAATLLNLPYSTLRSKLKKYNIL